MPDQWTEIAYVAISDEDGNQYQFGTITDTIDIAWGARDIESIATVSAGRVTKFIPEEVTEITLELYPVGISSSGTTPNGIHGWFMGMAPNTTSGTNNFTRKKFRVAVVWTTLPKASVTDAAGALGSGDHLRFSFWSCYLTSATSSFTDDILKSTVTFKCPPYNRAGSALIKAEEADNGTLDSLGAFGSGGSYTP
jgi:hypothetical protein